METLTSCVLLIISVSLHHLVIQRVEGSEENIQGKIHVRLFKNGDSSLYSETALEEIVTFLRSSDFFDPSKAVIILFHGINMKADNGIMRGVVDAFGKSGKSSLFNVITLQMVEVFKNNLPNKCHPSVVQNAEIAGNRIGEYLSQAVAAGLTDPGKLHFAGYSLGAHTAGFAASTIARKHSLINYIAGLDPAGYGFCLFYQQELGTEHLTSADARTVHLFHTNTYYYGSGQRLGTANFHFNNGVVQPGCYTENVGCSHARVMHLFKEAILDDKAFVGRQCASFVRFASCVCDSHATAAITFPPDQSVNGVYYVRTRDSSPFGLGSEGAVCHWKDFWSCFYR